MAYVYSRLANQMGADDGKQNIFGLMPGQEQGGGGGSSGPAFKLTGDGGGEAGAGSPTVKDTGEGDAKNTMNLQSGAQQAQIAELNRPAQAQEQSKQVYGNIGEAIQGRKAQLQDEAQKYQEQAQKSTTGDLYGDVGSVKKSVGSMLDQGDQGFKSLQSFLSGEAAPQVQEYKTGVTTGDIRIPETQAQLAETLQRQSARPTYTAGQARLDAALLGGSQQFQSEQARLRDEKERLEGQRIRAAEAAQRQQEEAARRYESQQSLVKDVLRGMGQDLYSAQEREMADYLAAGPSEEQIRRAYEAAKERGAIGDLPFNYGDYGIDPSTFYSREFTESARNPLAYLDEAERGKYGNIMALLGESPEIAGDFGPLYTENFDVSGYLGQLGSAYASRQMEQQRRENEARMQEEARARQAISDQRGAWTPEGRVMDEMQDAIETNQRNLYQTLFGERTGEQMSQLERRSMETADEVDPILSAHKIDDRLKNVGRTYQRGRKMLGG